MIPVYRSPGVGNQASEANGVNPANHSGNHATIYLSNMPEGAAQYAGNGHDPGFHVFYMDSAFLDSNAGGTEEKTFGDLQFPLVNKNGLQGVTEFRIPAGRADEFNSFIDQSRTKWVPAYDGWWDDRDLE